MKKITEGWISVILAAALAVCAVPVPTFASDAALTISSAEEFRLFAEEVNGGTNYEGQTIVLTKDINLGGEASPWTPAGTSMNSFKGVFDGGNHVISGLYIASGSSVGLFGDVNGGAVKNLVVQGSVSGTNDVAGVVGRLTDGTVSNCGSKADVKGGSSVGGVVGSVNGASVVSGCYNSGAVSGSVGYIGGVTGQHWKAGTVESCYNVGTVTGPATVGGVAGGHKASSPVLINCYNAGEVIDSAGNKNNIGMLVGATRGTASGCLYLSGSAFAGTGAGDKAGISSAETINAEALGSAFKNDTDKINGGYPVLLWQEKVPDAVVASYEQLKAFADDVNGGDSYEGKLVRLDVNIFIGGQENPWTPIGVSGAPFKGVFDGGNHVISGLYIASGSSVGLFGDVNGGAVKNLVVQGSVSGTNDVAGVVGRLTDGTVSNCGNKADVKGGSSVGGVVGSVNGASVVSGCYNSGAVSGSVGYIGGVTGQHWKAGTVESCYNVGTVTGPATVGGVTGGHKASSPVLINCYNAGEVIDSAGNKNNIGMLVGATRGTASGCLYLSGSAFAGTGAGDKAGISSTETVDAEALGSAFESGKLYPVLLWESSVSTDKPVRPSFVESTELSARLAGYIKEAVASKKANSGISAADTLLGNEEYMDGASSTGTDWMALAMGRFGYFDPGDGNYYYMIDDGEGYTEYLSAMQAYIEKSYNDNDGILHTVKATEWHRAVVAITALGGNPLDFGTYNGTSVNLIADGSYNCVTKGGPGAQGINGWIWGLISMDTCAYELPDNAKYTRDRFITEILKLQLTDGVNGNEYGGWVLGGYGSNSDVDITAMAVQSLAPYYNDDTIYTYTNESSGKEVSRTVRECVDEALDRLGAMLNENAGFTSWNTENAESIAQVVVALTSLGIDPAADSRFITAQGETLLDGMLKFRLADGGFCHVLDSGWNSMANDQATYALVSYWRLENGMRALYDMRSDWTEQESAVIESAVKSIKGLPEPSSSDYKTRLKYALQSFRAVPDHEKRYVNNYSDLAAALRLIGGEAELDTDTPYAIELSITKRPDKIQYYEGDTFDGTGMEVTAIYSDGSSKVISGYKVNTTGELTLECGAVYITYGVLKAPVEITVREKMPWEGDGTEESPYLIKTADDLADLDYYVRYKKMNTEGVFFRMTRDINLKHIENWHAIAGDASYMNAGFRGHFDGDGHAVWNLNSPMDNGSGLFGYLGDGAVIENLEIASGTVGGKYCYSLGGIAGEVYENAVVVIRNCRNAADIKGLWGIGGILGCVHENGTAIIENCSNSGTITAEYQGGGIIGAIGPNRWKNNGASANVANCYNVGSIGGYGYWGNGGIAGNYQLSGTSVHSEIINCYNAGTVSGAVVGAVIGSAEESDVRIENVYYKDVSGLPVYGIFDDGGQYSSGVITGDAVSKNDEYMKTDEFVKELGNAFVKDTDSVNDGYPVLTGHTSSGKEPPVYAGLNIGTAEELKTFAERVNSGESFKNKTVAMTGNIDLSGISDWTPIGTSKNQFDGYFDGCGYAIDNLTSSTGGLFGTVGADAVICNVGVASGEIGGEKSNLSFMGGIAGWSNGADIINCWNGADINCSGYSGGIVGTVRDGGKSIISGCFNVGNISGRDTAVGGIVGHLDTSRQGTSVEVTVKECYNTGVVSGRYSVGGIAGKAQDGHEIMNCYNAGAVTSEIAGNAGAIAGDVTSDNSIVYCYYNSDINMRGVLGNNDTTEGRTDTELKSDGFLLLLGSSFKEDKYALVNQGYPLLFWQTTEDADRVTDVIAKIESIGAVTLGGADKINEARNAYDDLDGELKALVSNLQALKQAEELLASMQSLQQAKEGAAKQLEAYKNPSDYRAEQQKELKSAVERGMLAIDKAQSAGEVSSALTAAKAVIDGIKTDKQLVDEEAAGIVVSKINAIGAVKLESENMIKDARKAYDALAEDVRTLVDNYDILIRAEAELERLKAASAPQNPSGDNSDSQITPPDTDGNMSVLSVPFAVGVICLGLLIKRRKRSA